MILLDSGLFNQIIISAIVFLVIILILVVVLLYARSKLVPSGPVKLTINEEKEIEVSAGSTLLNTMSAQQIFIPSACGGGGTCAMCKVQVHDGGGSILPTEVGYFTRKEQQTDWRLACQVKVKEDMNISIPPEIFGDRKSVV